MIAAGGLRAPPTLPFMGETDGRSDGSDMGGGQGIGRWIQAGALAALIAALTLSGKMDAISDAASTLTDKDLMIRWTSVLAGATRGATPVTLIDVDSGTMALFGAPDRTPRDLVAGLLRLAAAKKPRGVFLDVDLGRPGPDAGADAALRAVLAEWPAEAPTLIVSRRFAETPPREKDGKPGLAPLPFAFDDAVAGRANIRQAASLGLVDSDSVLRRWRLSQTVCDGDRGVTFPSPQLVAASLDADRPAADLDAFLAWRARRVCARDGAPAPVWPRNAANETNIAFLFSGEAGAPVPAVAAAGRETPVFRRIPAHSLVDARREALRPGAVADDLFAGRLVVIGATHMDAADLHLTPIGRLPGAVIASNAIVSAPAVLNSFGLAPWGRTLMAFVVFAGLAAMSFRFRAMAAGVIVSLACLALAPLLGRVLAPAPALEIIFAALAMLAMFAGLESLIEVARAWRSGLGWRALLKKSPRETA
jgi:CHASE2 domain-containing sensor protein